MFQLEVQLEKWRARFSGMEGMRCGDIEELEQHARDSMESLKAQGLTEEEAFLIATHRIGDPAPVGREFGKVNVRQVWGYRVFWMLAGYLLLAFCGLTVTAISSLVQFLAALSCGDGWVLGALYIGMSFFCWIGIAYSLLRWSYSQGDGRPNGEFSVNPISMQLVIGGTLVVAIFAELTAVVSRQAMLKILPIADIGEAFYIAGWGNSLFAILIPVILLFVMLTIRRRTSQSISFDL